tara:strand:- start:1056 stop:1628 length:573 start_codon:yes stop_codon:yes gene_type:complete
MIHEISNFLNPDACKAAIDYFESIDPDDPDKESPKNLFFNKRSLDISLVDTLEVRRKFRAFDQMMIQTISKLYPEEEFIFTEYMNIVKWPNGLREKNPKYSMEPHTDNEDDPDIGEYLNQRHWSSVCYLNDDYDGGHTIFPDHNRVIVPEVAKVIFFPSTYLHGVTRVSGGDRYTIASWFTRDSDSVSNF